jgi:hypothetical protein
MLYIGFDNGVTSQGIGVVSGELNKKASLYKLPVKKELSYTKEAKHITRLDYEGLCSTFGRILEDYDIKDTSFVLIGLERPMINSTRFNASLSAIRALEATLIAIEKFSFPFEYVDSKEWQKVLLPKNIKGSDALKDASRDIGKRMFPCLDIKKDADGLLIAEYLRRKKSKTT